MNASTAQPIELRDGDLRLALRPDLGGSVAGLWHRGVPVLRSTEPALLAGPRQSACFPLVPYSNRLGMRRFTWQGGDYATRANFESSPHSLHGVGWLRAWRVAARDETSATLVYRHAPDADWPFAFEVQQRFALDAGSLRLTLRLTNTGSVDQPAGLGWHPYFPRRAHSRLKIAVTRRWNRDALELPADCVAQSPIEAPVASLDLDHCFGAWTSPALIEDECFSTRLSSELSYLVIFTPPGLAHYCVEPVSHANNAINAADPLARGLVALRPGESLDASMTLAVEPR